MPVMNNIFIFSTKYLYEKSYLLYDSQHYIDADKVLLNEEYYKNKRDSIICEAWNLFIGENRCNDIIKKDELNNLCREKVEEDYEVFCEAEATTEGAIEDIRISAEELIRENAEINDEGQLWCLAYYYKNIGTNNEKYDIIMQRLYKLKIDEVLSNSDFNEIPKPFQEKLKPLIEESDFFSRKWSEIAMRKHNTYNNIYAIRCLDYPLGKSNRGEEEGEKWIKTLVKIAKVIDPTNSIINLILHDKDMQDARFHKDFVVLEDKEVNELYGSEINGVQVHLRVSFFMHTYNDIVKFLLSKDQGEINECEKKLISIIDRNIKQQNSLRNISNIYQKEDTDMKAIIMALKKEKEDVCWEN